MVKELPQQIEIGGFADAVSAGRETHVRPEVLASKLEEAVKEHFSSQYETMNDGQKIYLNSWLLALSGYITTATEEKRRLKGEIPMRELTPASGLARSHKTEHGFFDAMLNGKLSAQDVHSIASPDEIVYTVHPNFAGTKELVDTQQAIINRFLGKGSTDMGQLGKDDATAAATLKRLLDGDKKLVELLGDALGQMQEPRKKRSRADEVREGFADYVPRVVDSNLEEIAIMLKRAQNVGVKLPEQLSIKQLDNLSAATSDHSSWITDGDGKTTSRAWDNDYIIAIERRTLTEKQLDLLKKVSSDLEAKGIQRPDVNKTLQSLQNNVAVFTQIERAAGKRMLALSALQSEAEDNPTPDRQETGKFETLRKEAQQASVEYNTLIENNGQLLRNSTSKDIVGIVKELKKLKTDDQTLFSKADLHFVGKDGIANVLTSLDALYLSANKGDFPIKLERRENANQHKQTIRLLLDDSAFRDAVIRHQSPSGVKHVTGDMYANAMGKNDHALILVLEHLAEILDGKGTKTKTRLQEALDHKYKLYANMIDPKMMPDADVPPEMRQYTSELDVYKALLLSDVANMWIAAKYYPDAFKRTVIAEAATPDDDTLKSFDEKRIQEGASLRGKSDMLTLHIFKKLVGAKTDTTALLEDPYSVLNSAPLWEEMLKDPKYYPTLGIDLNKTEKPTLKLLGENGQSRDMTAYEFLQRQGFSDGQMTTNKLDIKALKEAAVYVGPAKMLANSDSAKRGTLAASTLNDVSVKECFVAGGRNLVKAADGKNYMYVNPTYLGQGGALVRTVGVGLNAQIYTEQGEHAGFRAGVNAAPDKVNRMIGRMVSANDNEVSRELAERAMQEAMILGNQLGFKNAGIDFERAAAKLASDWRIKNTRDDWRYMNMLEKYGMADMSNYSARPAGRTASGPLNFVNIRAIGLGAKEMEIYTNITGMAQMFEFEKDDYGRDFKLKNLDKFAKFFIEDQTGQHNFAAGVFALNMFDATINKKWKDAGIIVGEDEWGRVRLTKGNQQVSLTELAEQYEKTAKNFEGVKPTDLGKEFADQKNHYKGFDQADMTLAVFHLQAQKLLQAFDQIKRSVAMSSDNKPPLKTSAERSYPPVGAEVRVNPESLVPDSLRPTVSAYKNSLEKIHTVIGKLRDEAESIKGIKKENRNPEQQRVIDEITLARDSYYQLLESGQPHIGRINYVQPLKTAGHSVG